MPFLFNEIIFGPVRSRRLGLSLGINLLPTNRKVCSFNCIYCECGWTENMVPGKTSLPEREEVHYYLAGRLRELAAGNYLPDAITYAGNGEPTLHPDFPGIVADTLELRDHLSPGSRVSVLSNASQLHRPEIFEALKKLDMNIQKLDAGTEAMMRLINQPSPSFSFSGLIENLQRFEGRVIIQTMFLRGTVNGVRFDNSDPAEVEAWIGHLRKIGPSGVMIYSLARATPASALEEVPREILQEIAQQVNAAGLHADIY